MMKYYRMDWKVDDPDDQLASIDEVAENDVPWTMGIPYGGPVVEPIRCTLDPDAGRVMPDLFLPGIPAFSDRMLAVLDAAGVDNIVRYRIELVAPDGNVHTNYKAVNIIGAVMCADLSRSEFRPGYDPPLMKFDRLVIDQAKAGDLPFFRLGENPLFILVAEHVKQAIEAAQLVGVRVISLDDPDAY